MWFYSSNIKLIFISVVVLTEIHFGSADEGKRLKYELFFTNICSVLRGPVDHSIVVSAGASCSGYEDGTKCIKRCIDLTCTSLLARCYEGRCKRFGHHPCDTSENHSCCCGNCYLPKVVPIVPYVIHVCIMTMYCRSMRTTVIVFQDLDQLIITLYILSDNIK